MQTETTTIFPKTISNSHLLETARQMGPVLSQYVNEEKNNRRLSRPVINALQEAGFLRLFLPKSLGGLEADPVTTAKVVEEVASHNTAAGWSLMVANTTTWWSARLCDQGIKEIFDGGPDTFIVGS